MGWYQAEVTYSNGHGVWRAVIVRRGSVTSRVSLAIIWDANQLRIVFHWGVGAMEPLMGHQKMCADGTKCPLYSNLRRFHVNKAAQNGITPPAFTFPPVACLYLSFLFSYLHKKNHLSFIEKVTQIESSPRSASSSTSRGARQEGPNSNGRPGTSPRCRFPSPTTLALSNIPSSVLPRSSPR